MMQMKGNIMWVSQYDIPNCNYRNKRGIPKGGTLRNNGSCPVTISNILRNSFGMDEMSPNFVAQTAINTGSISQSDTNVKRILNALKKISSTFQYKIVTDFNAAKTALINGDIVMASSRPDGDFSLFGDRNIYIALIDYIDQDSSVLIHDPSYTAKREARNKARKFNVFETDENGMFEVKASAINRVCDKYYIFTSIPMLSDVPPRYSVGVKYTVSKTVRMRKRPNINSEFIKMNSGINKTAAVGTQIYCLDVRNDYKGNVFIHTESGWVLAYDSNSKIIYVDEFR